MKKKFLIVYLILLTIIITMTVVLGKYLQELKNNTLYEAENFYFRSDLLSEDIKSYTLQRGVNKIVIHLYNSEDAVHLDLSQHKYFRSRFHLMKQLLRNKPVPCLYPVPL